VIGNTVNPMLEAAYLFYYASDAGLGNKEGQDQILKNRLLALIGDAVVIANDASFDVFNALTLMDNMPILQDLKVSVNKSSNSEIDCAASAPSSGWATGSSISTCITGGQRSWLA
jgi:hypothetical protein